MSVFNKILLYILSIFPVYIIIIVLKITLKFTGNGIEFISKKPFYNVKLWFFSDSNGLVVLMILLLIISIFTFYRLKKSLSVKEESEIGIIESIEEKNIEYLSFLATYLIPLFTFDLSNIRAIIVFLITFSLMGYMYIKTNMFYANIGLLMSNYNIYQMTIVITTPIEGNENRINVIMISKKSSNEIEEKDEISFSYINKEVILFKSKIER